MLLDSWFMNRRINVKVVATTTAAATVIPVLIDMAIRWPVWVCWSHDMAWPGLPWLIQNRDENKQASKQYKLSNCFNLAWWIAIWSCCCCQLLLENLYQLFSIYLFQKLTESIVSRFVCNSNVRRLVPSGFVAARFWLGIAVWTELNWTELRKLDAFSKKTNEIIIRNKSQVLDELRRTMTSLLRLLTDEFTFISQSWSSIQINRFFLHSTTLLSRSNIESYRFEEEIYFNKNELSRVESNKRNLRLRRMYHHSVVC